MFTTEVLDAGRLATLLALSATLAVAAPATPARAADHGDTPLLSMIGRHDARITDLHAFVRGDRLVLSLCLDPTVPPEATGYVFASDLDVRIFIDNDSTISFDDPVDLATYGGTVLRPEKIAEDITFRIRFDDTGQPNLRTSGLSSRDRAGIRLFTGLRDDPFIRGPRQERNVAAIVVDIPLDAVLKGQPTLLIWATSRVPGVRGPFQELGARSLRSQFPENDLLNSLPPKAHLRAAGVVPDVVIYDTSRPAAYPNGRELADDVVDLVGDPRILANDAPFPTMNDLPFLGGFPYLAEPHPAP
jgi:hypothetical protein